MKKNQIEFDYSAYVCPFPDCNAKSQQIKTQMLNGNKFPIKNYFVVECQSCKKHHIWLAKQMPIHSAGFEYILVYPQIVNAPIPNKDMPDKIKPIYEEARLIESHSPKAAAALLRLALQHLLVHLGGKGKNINDDIGLLVENGTLNTKIQKSCDIVRVMGNNGVHPGEINLDEEPQIVDKLFKLLNIITDHTITENQNIDALYDKIPETSKDAIEKRDSSETK